MTIPRIFDAPRKSFFLLGPRGVGKSTCLRSAFPDAHVVNLLAEDTYQRLLANPGLLAAELRAVPDDRWVVLDEMQRLPALLNEVHRFIEEKRMRFVLCGSSARKLKRAGVNLLAGRALNRAMHPFTPEELGERFALDDALQHGLLPIVWDSDDRAETLVAYTQMYLKEEIQAEALVRNLPGFARFLPVAALYHGQTFNATNIAREAQVARTTVTGYLQIMEETLLCFQLPAYETRLRVRERKMPKWYWCDPGLVRAMKTGHDASRPGGARRSIRRPDCPVDPGVYRLPSCLRRVLLLVDRGADRYRGGLPAQARRGIRGNRSQIRRRVRGILVQGTKGSDRAAGTLPQACRLFPTGLNCGPLTVSRSSRFPHFSNLLGRRYAVAVRKSAKGLTELN